MPLHRMWGLDADTAPMSSFTIAIDDVTGSKPRARCGGVSDSQDQARHRSRRRNRPHRARGGAEQDAARGRQCRVDAQIARSRWPHMLRDLRCGIARAAGCGATISTDCGACRDAAGIPVLADESCLVAHDVPRLAGACDGRQHQAREVRQPARSDAADSHRTRARPHASWLAA